MDKKTDTSLSVDKLRARRGIVATIAFVIFINFFLYHAFGAFAITFILLGLYAVALVSAGGTIVRRPIVWMLSSVGIAAAFAVLLRGSTFVQFLSTVGSLGIGVLLLYSIGNQGRVFSSFSEILLAPLSLLGSYLTALLPVVKTIHHGNRTKSLVIGLVVGIPIALLLVQHFIAADVIFAYWVKQVADQAFLSSVMTHTMVSFATFLFLVPIAFFVIKNRLSARGVVGQFSFAREAAVVVSLVALVVGVFLVVQFPYIFVRVAAETDLSRYGVATFSEYVKQGFGEFLFISLILYIIGWFGILGKNRGMVQTMLMAECGIYIISLFRRVWLYVAFHGLTLGRVYGALFLVIVTLLFITLAGRLVWPKVRWVAFECVGIALIFFVFAFGNAERLVASWRPPTVNNRVDYVYLSRLSPDGYIGWQKAYAFSNAVLTDPSRIQKEVLDERDRQAIDYAGIILLQLTRRMHWYIRVYGSGEEQQAYANELYNFHTDMLTASIPDILRRAQEERAGGVAYGQHGAMEKQVTEELAWLKARESKGDTQTSTDLARMSVRYIPLKYYQPANPPISFYTVVTNDAFRSRTFDALDRLYLWNWSERAAFERMKTDMPIGELYTLQRLYVRYAWQISKQPQSEQEFTRDVSFDAPFLSPQ